MVYKKIKFNNNMVFQCYRCFYYCKNKKDMKKHLSRKNICARRVESHDFEEDKLEYLSLLNKSDEELIILKDEELDSNDIYSNWTYNEKELKNIIDISRNNNKTTCCFCSKKFFRKYELMRHLENNQCSVLKEKKNDSIINNNYINNKTIQNINNQHINNQQINNILINVYNNSKNINENGDKILNGFNEDWDISKIDLQKKLLLFVSDNKYSKTMEEILKNEKNMNILLGDNNNNESIVFQEDKFMNLNNDEIIVRTMYKLYNHLLKFYNDIKEEDLMNKDLKKHKNNLKEKYDDFNNNNITKEIVKNILLDIFHNKKEEVLEKFTEFNKYLSINEENNKIGF